MTTFAAPQRTRRSGVERTLIVLEVLLSVGAFGGAVGLLLELEAFAELIAALPFGGSTLVAGLALGLFIGLVPAVVVYGTLRRRRWARPGHVVVGVVLVAWIVAQVALLGPPIHALQVGYLVYGIVITWLGERRLREHD